MTMPTFRADRRVHTFRTLLAAVPLPRAHILRALILSSIVGTDRRSGAKPVLRLPS